MLDTIQTTGLNAIQVAALRKADRVAFFHRDKPDATGETSYIEAIKSPSPSERDPFAKEVYVILPCEFRVTDYTRGENKIPYGSDASPTFYGDKLLLLVTRGEKVLTFHVDTSICEDNSARMIRKV